jgi:hypothetical protein
LARETPPAWIGQYLTGAVGEERTAKAVDPLLRAGWFIAHDLDRGQFNIDHVLVGPAGVFVLETKNLHGMVLLDGDQVMLTRPGRERPITRAAGGHGTVVRTQPTPTPSSGSVFRFVPG